MALLDNKTIWSLQLGSKLTVGEVTFTRVPGGWITKVSGDKNSVFVPYDSEFKDEDTVEKHKKDVLNTLVRNFGDNWRNASDENIIDALFGDYTPF